MRTAIEWIRDRVMSDILASEAQARYPGSRVHREVEIWVAGAEATIGQFNAALPGFSGERQVLPTPAGRRVFTVATDLDLLVVEPQPSGKARLAHHQEIKTGSKDRHAKADKQLQKGRSLLQDAAAGTEFIRLFENGTDITNTIDMTTAPTISSATRGPAGKEFDESIGAKANDIWRLMKALVEGEI